ncbi:MAG: hypothetical protein ABR899_05560 [Candidatus Krumholzibacteriaceae bacterium]|jgi:hypothetical protein
MEDESLKLSYRHIFILAFVLPVAQRAILGFWPCDDAFITYRYAHNLALHRQLTFNIGHPVFGCTTLLYALILSLGKLLGASIPAASWIITLIGEIAVLLMLVRIATGLSFRPFMALAIVATYILHPVIALNGVGGMETSLFLSALLGFVLFCHYGFPGYALILCALCVWIRWDGLILFPVWIWWWWTATPRRFPVVGSIVSLSILIGYLLIVLNIFGAYIPQSVIAKSSIERSSLMGSAIVFLSYPASAGGLIKAWYWFLSPSVILIPGIIASFIKWRTLHRTIRLLLVVGCLYALPFIAAGRMYAMLFPWYYVPFLVMTLIPAIYGLEILLNAVRRRMQSGRSKRIIVFSGSCIFLLIAATAASFIGGAEILPSSLVSSAERATLLLDALKFNLGILTAVAILIFLQLISMRSARTSQPLRAVIVTSTLILAIASLCLNYLHISDKYARRESAYLKVGSWATKNLGSAEWIGAIEIGAIGWAAIDNNIFDERGLVTPEAIGTQRSEWTRKHRPALIVNLSSSEQGMEDENALPGYTHYISGHNCILIRNDILASWMADPPLLE